MISRAAAKASQQVIVVDTDGRREFFLLESRSVPSLLAGRSVPRPAFSGLEPGVTPLVYESRAARSCGRSALMATSRAIRVANAKVRGTVYDLGPLPPASSTRWKAMK